MTLSITDLKILVGSATEDNYEKIPVDLNKNTTGKALFLACKRDKSQQDPRHWVTAIDVIRQSDPVPDGWVKDPTDLNLGTNKNPLFLVYKKGGSGHPVKDIKVVEERYNPEQKMAGGYRYVNRDLNQGAGGAWLYLTYSKISSLITDVKILEGKDAIPPEGYERIQVDLNQLTKGQNLWLAFRRDPVNQALDNWITGLDVIEGADTQPPVGKKTRPI